MDAVPLSVAGPAAAAAAALSYLNVKTGFWHDRVLIGGMTRAAFGLSYRNWRDRINSFYLLEDRANNKSSANKPFLLFQGRVWTYRQVYDMALKYGTWLQTKWGVKKGDIVAINLMNSDHFCFLTFGLWSIGARPAYINYNLTGKALIHCASLADSVLMMVDPDVAKNVDSEVREKLEGLTIVELTSDVVAEVEATKAVRLPDAVRAVSQPRELAILIYTSGTTGLPKAAVVSWTKIVVGSQFVKNWLGTQASDTFYTCMPMYHSSASIFGMMHCLEAGCSFAIGRKFSTKTFWKEVRETDATMIQYVGETCRYLTMAAPQVDPVTGEDLDKKHRVRLAFGNGLRPDVWEKFKDRFGIETIGEFYAATEGTSGLFNLSRNDFTRGAIGRNGWLQGRMLGKRTAIVAIDPDTDQPARDPKTGLCIQVKRGDPGELMFMLPDDPEEAFQGYYKNPDATKGKMLRDVKTKGDAAFRTGDLVSWDSEGRMFFQDRLGDTFRWKSENVATTEVSQMMGLHDAIHEANVYGVELPNHDGRAGCASLALAGQAATNGPDDTLLRSLAEHAREKLPKYAVPIFLRVGTAAQAQITGTNKQQKHGLRVEGVDPAKVGGDKIYWLKGDSYAPFTPKDWEALQGGQVKL